MIGFNYTENKKFGRVYEPYRCCDPTYQVYDEHEKMKYVISGDCCQCGLMFTSCGKCYETKFSIFDANNNSNDPASSIGSITRKNPGVAKALFTDADNYNLVFPSNATPYDKLMLIGATLIIDYAHFEDNGSDGHNRNGFY